MFPSFMMLAHPKTYFDEEVDKLKSSLPGASSSQQSQNQGSAQSNIFQRKQYRNGIRLNEQLIDSELSQQSKHNARAIIKNIKPEECDLVVMSPLRRSYQTFIEIFGDASKIQVYVEPFLANRLDNVAALGFMQENWKESLLKGFHGKIDESRVIMMQPWFVEILSTDRQGQLKSIHKQIEQACTQYLRDGKQLQSEQEFSQRMKLLRQQLLVYHSRSKKKILLIADREVLEHLTSTAQHEDYSLVNKIPFDFGIFREEFIIIEGVIGQKTSIIPFCK